MTTLGSESPATRQRLAVYLDDDVKAWLEEQAAKQRIKPSTWVAQLISAMASDGIGLPSVMGAIGSLTGSVRPVGDPPGPGRAGPYDPWATRRDPAAIKRPTSGGETIHDAPGPGDPWATRGRPVGDPPTPSTSTLEEEETPLPPFGGSVRESQEGLADEGPTEDSAPDTPDTAREPDHGLAEFELGWASHRDTGASLGTKRAPRGNCAWRQWVRLLAREHWAPEDALARWRRHLLARAEYTPQPQRLLRPENGLLTDEALADVERNARARAKAGVAGGDTLAALAERSKREAEERRRHADETRAERLAERRQRETGQRPSAGVPPGPEMGPELDLVLRLAAGKGMDA